MSDNKLTLSTDVRNKYAEGEAKDRLFRFRIDWSLEVIGSGLSKAAVKVAWLLALEYMNFDPSNQWFGCAWPSKPTLAEKTHVSLESVKRGTRELLQAGFLKKVGQRPNNGFQNSGCIIYAFALPGATCDPGVNTDRGSELNRPGVKSDPPPGVSGDPQLWEDNSLNNSLNLPIDAHLSMRIEGESLNDLVKSRVVV